MAWTSAKTNVDWRSDDPRQDFKARQPLPARSIRTGGMGCVDQAQELGAPWTKNLDRGRQEAVAPQRSSDRARQQACPDCMERFGSRPRLRGEQASGRVTVDLSIQSNTCRGLREDNNEMEVRSSRRLRTLVTRMAYVRGLSANEIAVALISIMARSKAPIEGRIH